MEDGLVLQMRYLPISSWFCLNPCCNGRWSRTIYDNINDYEYPYVLILVVMEDGLVPDDIATFDAKGEFVLILVVMEDGLVLDLIRLY